MKLSGIRSAILLGALGSSGPFGCKTKGVSQSSDVATLAADVMDQRISKVLEAATSRMLEARQDGDFWNLPSYLGPMYVSQFVLLKAWIEADYPTRYAKYVSFDPERFKALLKSTRLDNGSWEMLRDANHITGNLNATILNYAALKALGEDSQSPQMRESRDFVLRNGGIEASSLFTKLVMALHGNYPWAEMPVVPYFIFSELSPVTEKDFGQWIGPHLYPIAYLKEMEASRDLGPRYDLSELHASGADVSGLPRRQPGKVSSNIWHGDAPGERDRDLIRKMLDRQKQHGSFGAYTPATLFTMLSFLHFHNYSNYFDVRIAHAMDEGLKYIEAMYFQSGDSAYMGSACDGRYWDTALMAQAIVEAGTDPSVVSSSETYLRAVQDKKKTGGYPFGWDFETYMDTDDTAEILLLFKKLRDRNVPGGDSAMDQMALSWLTKMQNSDGGWGAFDRNNTGSLITKFFTRDFEDSADMFDESSVDVTGHVLEALGTYGVGSGNPEVIRKAIDYLFAPGRQADFGGWSGRWGVNYIYGTSAAVLGLTAAGIDPSSDRRLQLAASWLKSCPNKDGGFGESFNSYVNERESCHGVSTPTQTAWALQALIALGEGRSAAADGAARYLVDYFERKQGWDDPSLVGTGHPEIVPMVYPSYPWAFPMMALSRYRNLQ